MRDGEKCCQLLRLLELSGPRGLETTFRLFVMINYWHTALFRDILGKPDNQVGIRGQKRLCC